MTINAITEASIGLEEKYIPMVVSYIDFLKSYQKGNTVTKNELSENKKTPKDALNIFQGSLYYMAEDFNETPEEFKEYM